MLQNNEKERLKLINSTRSGVNGRGETQQTAGHFLLLESKEKLIVSSFY